MIMSVCIAIEVGYELLDVLHKVRAELFEVFV